jgi:transcriptional regulator with XRE-family HTH domain
MSLRELAEWSGVSKRTISALKRGEVTRPHLRTLQRLAAALGVSVDDLSTAPPYRHWTFCEPERQAQVLMRLFECGRGANRDGTMRVDYSGNPTRAEALIAASGSKPAAVACLDSLIAYLADIRQHVVAYERTT